MMSLSELAERCELESASRVLDAEIYVALDPELENLDALAINGQVGSWVPQFTVSLDDALTLVPEGWRWIMREACPDKSNPDEKGFFARLETRDFEIVTWGKGGDWITDIVAGQDVHCWAGGPALALCAAALKARAASVDALPKGRDVKQARCVSKGSAVPKADAQIPPGDPNV